MPVIDVIDEKKYGRLLAKHLPGVIRRRTAEEDRLIQLLERLGDDYDEQRMKSRLDALEPLDLLKHLIEEGGLKQIDLVDCFGSQSIVSAVMAGKRQIYSGHARRLSRRFGLPLAMFIR
jgi:HTH-type transcriptional regulator / antitoxin HigA